MVFDGGILVVCLALQVRRSDLGVEVEGRGSKTRSMWSMSLRHASDIYLRESRSLFTAECLTSKLGP